MIRYAITHVGREGVREVTYPSFKDTLTCTVSDKVERLLSSLLSNSSQGSLRNAFGPQSINTFEVRPVWTSPDGTANSIYPKS